VGRETGAAGVGRLSDVRKVPGVSSFKKKERGGGGGDVKFFSLGSWQVTGGPRQ